MRKRQHVVASSKHEGHIITIKQQQREEKWINCETERKSWKKESEMWKWENRVKTWRVSQVWFNYKIFLSIKCFLDQHIFIYKHADGLSTHSISVWWFEFLSSNQTLAYMNLAAMCFWSLVTILYNEHHSYHFWLTPSLPVSLSFSQFRNGHTYTYFQVPLLAWWNTSQRQNVTKHTVPLIHTYARALVGEWKPKIIKERENVRFFVRCS